MRSYQVFAAMSPDEATSMLQVLSEKSPAMFQQAVAAAAVAMKTRPASVRKLPLEKRAQMVRRALTRVAASPVAEELLAVYFLECRKELLVEWLDQLGLAHEDGTLADDAPNEPEAGTLTKAVDAFRTAGDDWDRELLLRAFAAQTAIAWPALDALVTPDG